MIPAGYPHFCGINFARLKSFYKPLERCICLASPLWIPFGTSQKIERTNRINMIRDPDTTNT